MIFTLAGATDLNCGQVSCLELAGVGSLRIDTTKVDSGEKGTRVTGELVYVPHGIDTQVKRWLWRTVTALVNPEGTKCTLSLESS